MTVTIDDIRAAAAQIRDSVTRTPLVHSRTLSEICGAELHLKLENLQYTASFKERGAVVRLLALSEAERAAGVIAVSAGNHAQAVAYHAARLGIAVTVVVPRNTPHIKVANTAAHGARIELHGANLGKATEHAMGLAAQQKLVLVHPYDDARIIAGQGTVALEMLRQRPDLEVLVVPIGGGGLIAGCATAAKAINPDVVVIGVQAALYPTMHAAVSGGPPAVEGPTIAEGIAVKTPGRLTQPVIAALVSEIVLASEGAIERSVHLIAEIEKMVSEGAGATPLAAVLERPKLFAGRRVGLVISGGNIDSRLLASVLMRGLMRSGRLVRVRIEVSDQPGSLGEVTRLIGELGGNIVEVDHERWYHDVPVRLTELDMLIETRDAKNAEEVVTGLAAAGYPTSLLSSTALGRED